MKIAQRIKNEFDQHKDYDQMSDRLLGLNGSQLVSVSEHSDGTATERRYTFMDASMLVWRLNGEVLAKECSAYALVELLDGRPTNDYEVLGKLQAIIDEYGVDSAKIYWLGSGEPAVSAAVELTRKPVLMDSDDIVSLNIAFSALESGSEQQQIAAFKIKNLLERANAAFKA